MVSLTAAPSPLQLGVNIANSLLASSQSRMSLGSQRTKSCLSI
jgi:hypothetical protein